MSTTVETILLYTIAAGFLSIVYGYFTGKNILNKIHICLCPIILGGGRPSFVPDKYIELNNQKSFKPNHYHMGKDILFDIEIN